MFLRFFFSPFPWLMLILLFFFELNWKIIPLSTLAITQYTISHPSEWYTIFTAGLTHKTLPHLLTNLSLLTALSYLFTQKISSTPFRFFTKLGLLINLLHGLTLSFLIQGSTLPTFVYGSSGIVCGLASFLRMQNRLESSYGFRILQWVLLGTIGFSALDILFLSPYPLSSLSHLLGILLGFVLSCKHLKKE